MVPAGSTLANEVSVGKNGTAWKIGTSNVDSFGNHDIAMWNGSGWTTTNGGAVKIAVASNDVPWVLDAAGTIYRRTSASPSLQFGWEGSVSGTLKARDIAAGADGSIWVLGKPSVDSYGNGAIYKWNGSSWDKTPTGAAQCIAVTPDGIAWVVSTAGNIFRRSTSSPAGGSWETLSGIARDIAVSPDGYIAADNASDGYPWVIGNASMGGGNYSVHSWDEQRAVSSPVVGNAPAAKGWITNPGAGGVSIAVGPNAQVWVVDAAHHIWRQWSTIQSNLVDIIY
jgi:hypothetical protein